MDVSQKLRQLLSIRETLERRPAVRLLGDDDRFGMIAIDIQEIR